MAFPGESQLRPSRATQIANSFLPNVGAVSPKCCLGEFFPAVVGSLMRTAVCSTRDLGSWGCFFLSLFAMVLSEGLRLNGTD